MEEQKYYLKGINGQLYVYEKKIEIARKGLFAMSMQGLKGVKTIPISEIKSIQFKPAKLSVGYIQFAVGGGIEGRRGLREAYYDENTITFKYPNNQIAEVIKNYIENLIINRNNKPTFPSILAADELKKYKELLDSGAITLDEFEEKKNKILNS